MGKMKTRPGAVTLLAFLAGLALLVASGSTLLDGAILIACGALFLVGSVVLMVKSARRREGSFQFGQLAALPRSWQRWILDVRDGTSRRR